MSLTQRERVIAQIQHRETDYLPYTIRFDSDLIEGMDCYGTDVAERLDAYYGNPAWRSLVDNAIPQIVTHKLGVDLSISPIYTDVYGSQWRTDRRPFHLVEPVLKRSSLDGFTFPDLDTLSNASWKERTLRAIEPHRDQFVVMGFGLGLWERTWALRGFESALMDAAAKPNWFEELIEQVANHQRVSGLKIRSVSFHC